MYIKKNIAVIAGGYSSEAKVSVKSAQTILNHLSKEKYNTYLVLIHKNKWEAIINNKSYPVDKNDFSITIKELKIIFDCAYIIIHGTPGEDGKLQGYFDMLSIPYTSCNAQISALTFNKWLTNQVLLNNGFNCAKSIILRDKNEKINELEIVSKLGLPCFVKPNDGGSSFGVSKVKEQAHLIPAIKKAFEEGEEVIIEAFLAGTEVTCGAYKVKDTVFSLPITEIVSHNEYFDYQAKYEGLSDEITPARISTELTNEIQSATKNIYTLLNLKGIVRIDFIIHNNTPCVIEVNTTPGMSNESLIPQQVAYQKNPDLATLLDLIIEEA